MLLSWISALKCPVHKSHQDREPSRYLSMLRIHSAKRNDDGRRCERGKRHDNDKRMYLATCHFCKRNVRYEYTHEQTVANYVSGSSLTIWQAQEQEHGRGLRTTALSCKTRQEAGCRFALVSHTKRSGPTQLSFNRPHLSPMVKSTQKGGPTYRSHEQRSGDAEPRPPVLFREHHCLGHTEEVERIVRRHCHLAAQTLHRWVDVVRLQQQHAAVEGHVVESQDPLQSKPDTSKRLGLGMAGRHKNHGRENMACQGGIV